MAATTSGAQGSQYVMASDRVLLYDVDPWNRLGFGVPAFGNVVGSRNTAILRMVHEVGQSQLAIMTHEDAMRDQPPSVNTVTRVGRMLNRVYSILQSRMQDSNEQRLEGGHITGNAFPWTLHPCPYFTNSLLRNGWLMEMNVYCMIALGNAMQHSDNNLPHTITQEFAAYVWQYFKRVKQILGVELLGLTLDQVSDDAFQFKDEHYTAYKPGTFITKVEALSTPGPLFALPTETDLRPLYEGIPASLIIPHLKQYPIGLVGEGFQGGPLPSAAAAVGTDDGSAIGPAGRPIGEPQT